MSGAGCYFVSCCALLYLLLQSPSTSELVEWSLCLRTELTARRWRRLPVAAKYEHFSVYVCALALAMCITRSPWKIGSVVCVCIRSCRAVLVCIEIYSHVAIFSSKRWIPAENAAKGSMQVAIWCIH